MGQITLNYDDSKRILDNPDASPDARVIAACFIAFFETSNHVDEIDSSTRAIVLKLSRMVSGVIDDNPPLVDEDGGES